MNQRKGVRNQNIHRLSKRQRQKEKMGSIKDRKRERVSDNKDRKRMSDNRNGQRE